MNSAFRALAAVVLISASGCSSRSEPAGQAPPARQAPAAAQDKPGPGKFQLEVVATTMTQIVVQWSGAPANASSFQLERATDAAFTAGPKTYTLDKGTFIFSDTDRPPVSKKRFVGDTLGPLLDPKATYYYRVKALLDAGEPQVSNTLSARVGPPVRGQEGDLWADIVLGQPGFGSNVGYQPTKFGVDHPGGVLIDKSVTPNRMYIADSNNNRILGFKSTSPKDGADIVIGQPDFGSAGGNGDSCAQLFPYRGKASAASLCFTNPVQISIGETVVRVNMAVDEQGNLYVPDIWNNRVLKYNSPFTTDSTADAVWGQADFTGNEPNRGATKAAANTLSLSERAGVALDAAGNLWVADSGNSRVLRFPKDAKSGAIADAADIVLGQPDFTSNAGWGYKRDLSQMWYPIDVAFDAQGNLYVCDGISNNFAGRILVFAPPFKSASPATSAMPIPSALDIGLDPERRQAVTIGCIVLDKDPSRMWFEKGTFTSELVDLRDGKSVTSVLCDQSSGIDVDSEGNLYTVNKWAGVYRFPASSWPLSWPERSKLVQSVVVKSNSPSAGSVGGILGITTFKDQLIIASGSRLMIWNKFDVNKLSSGAPADDVYGENDLATISPDHYLSSPQPDKSGRLWVALRKGGHTLEAHAYPLTRASKPVKTVPLVRNKEDVLPVAGGGAMHAGWADFLDFAVIGTGDKIWVADRGASRVFRINNVDGIENSSGGPYVDIVLGQNNLTDDKVHQGKDRPGPRSLAWPYNVKISYKGELLISDNGGECGTDQRILIYDAKRFPDKPEKCLFADDIGDPDMVIGTGGKLNISGAASDDPICSPFEVGVSARGAVVAPMNGYSAQRFPLVYLDPHKTTEPQIALGDFTAYPITCYIDQEENVYVGDYDWARVLVYKKPFKKIRY